VGGFDGGEGGCLCNVWLLFYGYPFVSGAGRYFVESKSNSKICRYIKPTSVMTYLCSFVPARAGGVEGGSKSCFKLEFAIYPCFGIETRWYRLPADTL
jgi:hypothetical protein